jgi:hypothetical protein
MTAKMEAKPISGLLPDRPLSYRSTLISSSTLKSAVTFLKRSLNNLRVSIRPEHPNAEDDGSIVPGQIKPDCHPTWFFPSHWQSGRAQNGIMAELVTIRPERGMNDADCHKYTESEGTVKLSDKVRWK